MPRNPFSPPAAGVFPGFRATASPFERRVLARKPWSAWILKAVATILARIIVLGMFRSLMSLLAASRVRWDAVIAFLAADAAIVMSLAHAVLGTQRRAASGRRLGLVCIGPIFLLTCYRVIQLETAGDLLLARPPGAAEGEFAGKVLVAILVGGWFFAFGFSKKARRSFASAPSAPSRPSDASTATP